jgi:hypothetical protein
VKMLYAIVVVGTAILSGCARQSAAEQPIPGWHLYTNAKYDYQIQYPDGYEVWETGEEGKQDGASIRIGYKEYQAPVPVLDVKIEPRTRAATFPTLGMQVPDMTVKLDDVTLDGAPGRRAVYRWSQNGELAYVQVYVQGVLFEFMSEAGAIGDFDQTKWWDIISTFRFKS